jgi:hypothetical protein
MNEQKTKEALVDFVSIKRPKSENVNSVQQAGWRQRKRLVKGLIETCKSFHQFALRQ